MSTHTAQDRDKAAGPYCWCCGADKTDDELVRLGNHPEVGICPDCARWVHRRATQIDDALHPSLAARLRAAIHRIRTAVIAKGWHQRGILGALLRRIDRYLP